MDRHRALRWGLRLLGLGLMAFVLVTQVRWHDTLTLVDGDTLVGRVQAQGTGYEVRSPTSAAGDRLIQVPAARVARRTLAGREAPAVVLGLPSLLERLGGRLPSVLLVLLLLASLVALTAWRWQVLVAAVDLVLGLLTAVRLTFVGLFFNIAVPGSTGGDVVKAFYAARLLGAPTRAVVSVFVDRFLGLFALILMAGLALLVAPADAAYTTPRLLVVACMGAGLLAALVGLSRRVRRGVGLSALARRLPFAHVLAEIDAALRLYRRRPGAVGGALALSLLNHAGSVAAAALLVSALGMRELGWGPLFVVVPLASLAAAVPLLPGGWGVGEVAYAFLLAPFGVEPTEAVGLSVLLRLMSLSVSLPGGVLWLTARSAPSRDGLAAEMQRAESGLASVGPTEERT